MVSNRWPAHCNFMHTGVIMVRRIPSRQNDPFLEWVRRFLEANRKLLRGKHQPGTVHRTAQQKTA